MTSSDYLPVAPPKRRRRSHRILRTFKLMLPFLLLAALGLLSAGVIRLVEVSTAARIPVSKVSEPGISGTGVEELSQRESQTSLLEGILPTSFLEQMPEERAADSLDAERALQTPGAKLPKP